MADFGKLMSASTPYLTDGGFETWLFFQRGFEAPEFAAITLVEDRAARVAMREYFDGFLELAEQSGTGFVLDTATWRACPIWAERLGLSGEQLTKLTREAAALANSIRDDWQSRVPAILLNGVIGPAGDGYSPDRVPTATEAESLHAPEVAILASGGVDMISAITMTNVGEAIGIARAVQAASLPVVISFTVETDGRLPTGDLLGEAIEAVDAATNNAPAYYMVNCAHPDHFRDAIASGEAWTRRIGGVRANASRLSHAELDEAEQLDQGDPGEFGHLHRALADALPNLRVVGGCCGTDHRHIGCVAHELHNTVIN